MVDNFHCGADYIRPATNLKSWKLVVSFLARYIIASGIKYDAIVFRGNSGSLVAPAVAAKLNKPFMLIRKQKEDTHSSHLAEGYAAFGSYIIVDDFVASGATVHKIVEAVKELGESSYIFRSLASAKCLGVFCYNSSNQNRRLRIDNDTSVPVLNFFVDVPRLEVIYINGRSCPRQSDCSPKTSFTAWLKLDKVQSVLQETSLYANQLA